MRPVLQSLNPRLIRVDLMNFLDKHLDKHYFLNKYEAEDMKEQHLIVNVPQPLPKSMARRDRDLRFLAWARLNRNRSHHRMEKQEVKLQYNMDLSGDQRRRT